LPRNSRLLGPRRFNFLPPCRRGDHEIGNRWRRTAQAMRARTGAGQVRRPTLTVRRARERWRRVMPGPGARRAVARAGRPARDPAWSRATAGRGARESRLGENGPADRWLADADGWPRHDGQRRARRGPEFRRSVFAHSSTADAKSPTTASAPRGRSVASSPTNGPRLTFDPIARAAIEELEAPRALGPAIACLPVTGQRHRASSTAGAELATVATRRCTASLLWIPIYPLSGWRVCHAEGDYHILAREPLQCAGPPRARCAIRLGKNLAG